MKRLQIKFIVSPFGVNKILRGDARELFNDIFNWYRWNLNNGGGEWVGIPNSKLLYLFKRKTPMNNSDDLTAAFKRLQKARNTLVEYGIIEFIAGAKGTIAPKYKINECFVEVMDEVSKDVNLENLEFFILSGDTLESNPFPEVINKKIQGITQPCVEVKEAIENMSFADWLKQYEKENP